MVTEKWLSRTFIVIGSQKLAVKKSGHLFFRSFRSLKIGSIFLEHPEYDEFEMNGF